jgi:hypothetical protein
MNTIVSNCSEEILKSLSNINDNIKQISFSFNTSELIEFAGKGCEKQCPVWQRLGYKFKEHNSPLLYWFEIKSAFDIDALLSHLNDFKINQNKSDIVFRATPALKSKIENKDSKILYVGCCRTTKLINRLFWHFGYYNVGRTQGLQLCHWTRDFSLDIDINVITFPQEVDTLIEVYEKYFAKCLNPIIGKH